MNDNLGRVDRRLMWEFCREGSGTLRLVITPEVETHLRPMVSRMLSRSPRLPGWTFGQYRVPESPEEGARMVETRTGARFLPKRVSVTRGESNRIDLQFEGAGSPAEHCFIFTEAVCGEEVLDKWIGRLTVSEARDPDAAPIEALCDAVASVRNGILASTPDRPWHEVRPTAQDQFDYAILEAVPDARSDIPFADLITVVTPFAECAMAMRGDSFYSCRFSRFSELFAYVAIPNAAIEQGRRAEWRQELEAEMDEAIAPSGLGAVIGGGTGLRLSYVYLALSQPEVAFPALRRALQSAGVHRDSCVLFPDADIACEWVGVYPKTRPPKHVLKQ